MSFKLEKSRGVAGDMTTEIKKAPNKSPRHRARELAMQGVYQWRVTAGEEAKIENQIASEKNIGRFDKELFSKLLRGALAQHAGIEAFECYRDGCFIK